jgi:uncharacterized RDD family membrane protein YckC
MTAWYYSDSERNRLGPVAASDLAELHRGGQLQPGTLVWREGLPAWTPWHRIMDEVLGPASPMPAGAPTLASAAATAAEERRPLFGVPNDEPALAVASGYNPYQVVDRVPASPYAPPAASIGVVPRAVSGGRVLYARFLKRFASNAVDGLLAGIAAYAVLIPVMLAMGAGLGSVVRGGAAAAGLGFGFIGLMYAIQIGVPALYYGAMQSSGWQATLGKRMTETKLTRTDGSPVTFWRGFLRSVAFVLSIALTCGLGAVASAIMTVTTGRRQALHDLICDTVVVDRHAFTEHADYQDESLNTVTKVVLGLYVLLLAGVFMVAVVLGILGARGG